MSENLFVPSIFGPEPTNIKPKKKPGVPTAKELLNDSLLYYDKEDL